MKLEFPSAVPEIPVTDINEAAACYQNNLGSTVDWDGEKLGLAARGTIGSVRPWPPANNRCT